MGGETESERASETEGVGVGGVGGGGGGVGGWRYIHTKMTRIYSKASSLPKHIVVGYLFT